LLAVAVAPLVVGLSGRQYEDPVAIGRAFDAAMLLCAGLLLTGAVVAGIGLRSAGGRRLLPRRSCPVDEPGWETAPAPAAEPASSHT
jgi:hypothetical protein